MFTDPKSSQDLYSNSIRRGFDFDAYGDKDTFEAIVLTNPIPIDAKHLNLFTDGTPDGSEKINKFTYRARIVGTNSPHEFLPNPCDSTYSTEPDKMQKLVAMHTLFVSKEEEGTGTSLPRRGATVQVKLTKNAFSYNLQVGEHLKVISRPQQSSISNAECTSLRAIMNNASASPLSSVGVNPDRIRTSFGDICQHLQKYGSVANDIGIPKEIFAAFVSVESNGRTTAIRFEPHLFNNTYKGAADEAMPFTNGGNGFSLIASETNKAAFERAFAINAAAAIKSTSWGAFQVLGSHLLKINSNPAQAVALFYRDPENTSILMVKSWFQSRPDAIEAANNRDFDALARRYNGSNYAANAYHINLYNGSQEALKCQ